MKMTDETLLYRVQDREGRGPFKPGFSHKWAEDRDEYLPSWREEFGLDRVLRAIKPGEHCGSACRTLEQLRRWFRPRELQTLADFGYHVVEVRANRVIAESAIQVVFACRKPLSHAQPIALTVGET